MHNAVPGLTAERKSPLRLRLASLTAIAALLVTLTGCSGGSAKPTATATAALATSIDGKGNFPKVPLVSGPLQSTATGLQYVDIRPGTGAVPADGDSVTIRWSGWLTTGASFSQGRLVQSSFVLGRRETLPGIDQGLRGMKAGGKRRLIIPPELAYGKQGLQTANAIAVIVPPDVTIIEDVELISVKPASSTATAVPTR